MRIYGDRKFHTKNENITEKENEKLSCWQKGKNEEKGSSQENRNVIKKKGNNKENTENNNNMSFIYL